MMIYAYPAPAHVMNETFLSSEIPPTPGGLVMTDTTLQGGGGGGGRYSR